MSTSPLKHKPRPIAAFNHVSSSWHDVAKTSAFQPGYGLLPTQRNFSAMLNFVESPLEWEAPEVDKIAKGQHPIIRYFSQLNRFIDPHKSMKNALFIAGMSLGMVLVLMVLGITQQINVSRHNNDRDKQAFLSSSALAEAPIGEENDALEATALFAVANGMEESNQKTKAKAPPFRPDPFKPLIKLEWLEKMMGTQKDDKTNTTVVSPPQKKQTLNPFPSKTNTASLGVPVESLIQFMGIISNDDPRKPSTVLLKLLDGSNSLMVSKRMGNSFEYGGNYFTLTSIKGPSLYLSINGIKSRVELSNTSSDQTKKTRTVSNYNQNALPNSDNNKDSTIEKLLNDLGNV